MRPTSAVRSASAAGYSLVELLISMGIFTLIMGATLAGLSNVIKGNDTILQMANMNNSVRAGMDLMVRDFLQIGSGLPAAHAVTIPNGAGAVTVRIPGPPGTNFATAPGDITLPALMPFPRQGPTINGVQTDAITILMADNTFLDMNLSSVAANNVVVLNPVPAPPPTLDPFSATNADRVAVGQLMLISKGSFNTLVQVTAVNTAARRLTFADGDSLRLNQSAAARGNLAFLNAQAPSLASGAAAAAAATRITRIRMISYYLENTTDPLHPKLVRRVNNGHPTTFNNNPLVAPILGTAVAVDATDLQLAYDINNGAGNPGDVEMVALDLTPGGACTPNACGPTQIRKVNLALTGRSQNKVPPKMDYLYNTLESQVSLRGMAFVDQYR